MGLHPRCRDGSAAVRAHHPGAEQSAQRRSPESSVRGRLGGAAPAPPEPRLRTNLVQVVRPVLRGQGPLERTSHARRPPGRSPVHLGWPAPCTLTRPRYGPPRVTAWILTVVLRLGGS